MIKRVFAVAVVLGLIASGGVALAGPASAAGVSVDSVEGGGVSFVCHATATVVPAGLGWGRGQWEESGEWSGDGTCQSGAASWQLHFSGWWSRGGAGGKCGPAHYYLYPMWLSHGSSSFFWDELWDEVPAVPGVFTVTDPTAPVYMPDSIGRFTTDADPCAGWPDASASPADPVPTPPAYHLTADWGFVSPNGEPVSVPSSLLQACVTVQDLVPRTCVKV
jgi:hypothetical protein